MKSIEKDELYENLKAFLKTRGIELQEGSYTHRMQQGCGFLADVVNLSQQAFETAKDQLDKQMDQMRQIIHERTAPKPPPEQPSDPASASEKTTARKQKPKARASKTGPRRGAGKKSR